MENAAASAPMRSPTLAELAANIRVARQLVAAMRVAPVVQPMLLSAREALLRAMEAYALELTARRLPIPPQLRDDLRLQRDIGRHPTARSF
ncbi:MAG TPA: hypothetical protein VGN48_12365 [Pedococcus sp.]|jgi:hypothetical protein|nr:hypothetical protein [Pedococcus sp.]